MLFADPMAANAVSLNRRCNGLCFAYASAVAPQAPKEGPMSAPKPCPKCDGQDNDCEFCGGTGFDPDDDAPAEADASVDPDDLSGYASDGRKIDRTGHDEDGLKKDYD
jgi:hypothetical protein